MKFTVPLIRKYHESLYDVMDHSVTRGVYARLVVRFMWTRRELYGIGGSIKLRGVTLVAWGWMV